MSSSHKYASILLLVCPCFVSLCSIAAVRASSDGLEKLDRLIAASPTSENYFRRASLRSQCGKHIEAISDLQQALLARPGEYKLLLAKAFELNRVGRFVCAKCGRKAGCVVVDLTDRANSGIDCENGGLAQFESQFFCSAEVFLSFCSSTHRLQCCTTVVVGIASLVVNS